MCFPESFVMNRPYLADIFRIENNIYLFVCLFACILICVFSFNHLGTSTGSFPDSFMTNGLDLAEIFSI